MPTISATIDARQMAEAERLLRHVKNGAKRAAVRAINKVTLKQRTAIVRNVATKSGIKPTILKKLYIRMKKANFRTLVGVIRFVVRPIPLISFGARQTARGVSYQVRQKRG